MRRAAVRYHAAPRLAGTGWAWPRLPRLAVPRLARPGRAKPSIDCLELAKHLYFLGLINSVCPELASVFRSPLADADAHSARIDQRQDRITGKGTLHECDFQPRAPLRELGPVPQVSTPRHAAEADDILAHARLAGNVHERLAVFLGNEAPHENELPQLRHLDVLAVEPRCAYRGRLERGHREAVAVLRVIERGLVLRLRVTRNLGRLAALLRVEHLPLRLLAEVGDDERHGPDDRDADCLGADARDLDLGH